MKYRVYQMRTEFATFVNANSAEEAQAKAEEKGDKLKWDTFEHTPENISYEAVPWGLPNPKDIRLAEEPSNAELLEQGMELNRMLCQLVENLDHAFYSQSDLIMYCDDWDRIVNSEIEPKELPEYQKNLKKFIETNKD